MSFDKADRLRQLEEYKADVARAFHSDGYLNMLNKVGTLQDNSRSWQWQSEPVADDMMLASMYQTNGLFAKIIDRPAEDAMAKGLDLSDLGEDLEAEVLKRLVALDYNDKMITAEKWSRLFGGSIIVMLIDDGRGLEEPVNWDKARGIEDMMVFERAIVQPDYATLMSYSFYDPDFSKHPWGQPIHYNVYSQYGQFRVHYSRCLIFKNGKMPEYAFGGMYQFWGIPEYARIRDAMRETITSHHDGTKLLERSVLGVYKMKNLSNLLATDEGEDKVIKRLQVIDMARNIINSMAIDNDGEDYNYINASMAGASDIIDRTCNMLSAVTDIPQTILFGKAPSGMDSTGDNDFENYYQLLTRIQANNIKKNTEVLVRLVLAKMALEGDIDKKELPEYEVKFQPFKQLSEEEQANVDSIKAGVEQVKAQTAQVYVDMQALDPSEVRKALSESAAYQIQGLVDEDNLELPEPEPDPEQGQANADEPTNPNAVDPKANTNSPKNKSASASDIKNVANAGGVRQNRDGWSNLNTDGGPGSGNFGHVGRPGQRGGSGAGGAIFGSAEGIKKPIPPLEVRRKQLKEALASGKISSKLNKKDQSAHKPGTEKYNKRVANGEHPSYTELSYMQIQSIINEHEDDGDPIIVNGQYKNVIKHNDDIGFYYDNKRKEYVSTNRATIHYSKTGAHLVPAKPKGD